MRFLLDAHVSGRSIGGRLRERGHDVRALDEEPELEGLDDELVLELASADARILVTFNIADFPGILREWGLAGRSHAGVVLIYGLRHHELGAVVEGIERALQRHPRQKDWLGLAEVISAGHSRA